MGEKNPDRAIDADRRAIADMRRINMGFDASQYYPARVPALEAMARLLVSMTVSFPWMTVVMAKRGIASSLRLLRLRPSLSLAMCIELPGAHFNSEYGAALF